MFFFFCFVLRQVKRFISESTFPIMQIMRFFSYFVDHNIYYTINKTANILKISSKESNICN